MELPAIVTLLAVLEYMFFSFQVGMGRQKYGVSAPATSGNPDWERLYRVQVNTVEQLVVFLPALWIFSAFVNPKVGASVGLLFVIGRFLYYTGYIKAAEKRTPGFLMGFLANAILVVGGLGGAILKLV